MSPATILDLTRRASDAIRSEYEEILDRIRGAKVLYVDETSIKVQGKKYWIWAFTTPVETFIAIRKSRGMKVLMEVLTRRFKGIIVCDGWKPYTGFTNRIQRLLWRIFFENPGILPRRLRRLLHWIKHSGGSTANYSIQHNLLNQNLRTFLSTFLRSLFSVLAHGNSSR